MYLKAFKKFHRRSKKFIMLRTIVMKLEPHIHLAKNARYRRAIVCGAPERASLIAAKLKGAEKIAENREYVSYLGRFKERDILVTSHGVGSAGAAICFNELIQVGIK